MVDANSSARSQEAISVYVRSPEMIPKGYKISNGNLAAINTHNHTALEYYTETHH